jgi:hypothetical protein
VGVSQVDRRCRVASGGSCSIKRKGRIGRDVVEAPRFLERQRARPRHPLARTPSGAGPGYCSPLSLVFDGLRLCAVSLCLGVHPPP